MQLLNGNTKIQITHGNININGRDGEFTVECSASQAATQIAKIKNIYGAAYHYIRATHNGQPVEINFDLNSDKPFTINKMNVMAI